MKKPSIAAEIFAVVLISSLLFGPIGCTPRPVAWPISGSHSQLTASDYEDAEREFSGGLMPLPDELAAVRCQDLLDRRDMVSAIDLGLAGLGGAGGIATLIPKDATPDEAKRWDLGLGISTLCVGTTAVILGALVRSWSNEFETECKIEKAAPVDHAVADEVGIETDVDGGTP